MPAERQAVEAGTSHAGADGGGMSEEPIVVLYVETQRQCLIALFG